MEFNVLIQKNAVPMFEGFLMYKGWGDETVTRQPTGNKVLFTIPKANPATNATFFVGQEYGIWCLNWLALKKKPKRSTKH